MRSIKQNSQCFHTLHLSIRNCIKNKPQYTDFFIFLSTVKQRHAEYVPDQLSEQEFWTRFFQSHYFHRDRITFSNKDLFADCARADDQGAPLKLLIYLISKLNYLLE